MKKVLSVIVSYNDFKELERALKSLTEQTYNSDIAIIDNSDKEKSLKIKEISKKYGIKYYIKNQKNIGSSGGYNLGMKLALNKGYDFIWLVDQDGYLDNKSLEELLNNKDKADILCARVMDLKDKVELKNFRSKKNFFGKPIPANIKNGYIDFFGSHGTLINIRILNNIGIYDNNHFFVGGEDYEYSFRARKSGIKIYKVYNSIVFHPNTQTKHYERLPKLSLYISRLKRIKKFLIKLTPFFFGVNYNNNLIDNDAYVHSYISAKYQNMFIHSINFIYSLIRVAVEKVLSFHKVTLISTLKNYFLGTVEGLKDKKY